MATPVNFFRSRRHYRRVFREGRLLLASEGMELQLQVLDHLRKQIKETFGENSAVDKALKVEIDPNDSERIIVRPGDFYIDGYPLDLQAGTDHLYRLGSTPAEITTSDFIQVDKTSTDDGGISINFGGGTVTPAGNYSLVVSIEEQLITANEDPFLRSANLTEDTAEVHRIVFNFNVVETADLDKAPIPYTGTADGNLVNEVEITRSGSLYSILGTTSLSGSETIDGRNLEVEIDNVDGTTTAAFPTTNTDLAEYIHGKLIDTNGVEYHITNIFVTPGNLSTITLQLDLEKTRPVQAGTFQPEPTVADGLTYKLRKSDLYVTASNNLPRGKRFWRIADVAWNGTSFTSIEDKRVPAVTSVVPQNATTKLVKGGVWDWDEANDLLTWDADAFVQIAGFVEALNSIPAGNVTLTADGQVAYVELNRQSGASGTLTVQTAAIDEVELTDNTFIIARRVGNDVLVGRSFLLKDGEFLELDGALAEINRYFGNLRIIPHETDGTKVRITGAETDKLNGTKLTQSIKTQLVKYDGAVVDFDTGDIFESDGVTPVDTFTPAVLGAGEFFWYSLTLVEGVTNADNTNTPELAVILAANGDTVEADAPRAAFEIGIQLGQVKVQEDAGSIADITYEDIHQLSVVGGSGAGGTAQADGGSDLTSLDFQVQATEDFSQDITLADSLVDTTETNEALWDEEFEYFRIQYDATNSVTGTGTSMTLSAAPSFTVVVGDILRVGAEARRITALGSINTDGGSGTPFTIEAAFSSDPSSAAATVSQVVYSKDLNNHTGGELAPSAEFTGDISEILVDYSDSEAAEDVVRDLTAAHVAFTASSDATNYSDVQTRTDDSSTEATVTTFANPGTNLNLRFFSNKTSGAGFVNVLKFDAYFHRDVQEIGGEILEQAIAFTDEVGTPINATVDNSGANTRIILDWSYVVSVRSGENNGQIEVYLNGQKIPRFINATLTPDASYTEVNATTIELDQDYSGVNLSVEVLKRRGVVDTNDENSTRIASLEENRSNDNSTTVDLTSSGTLTGGVVKVTRVGDQVTTTITTALTHASANTASSAAGVIPDWARPTLNQASTIVQGSSLWYLEVQTDGTLQLEYYDSSLAAVAGTGQAQGTISYNV